MQDTRPSTLSIVSEYFHHWQEKANSLCFQVLQEIVTDMNMQCIFLPGTVKFGDDPRTPMDTFAFLAMLG